MEKTKRNNKKPKRPLDFCYFVGAEFGGKYINSVALTLALNLHQTSTTATRLRQPHFFGFRKRIVLFCLLYNGLSPFVSKVALVGRFEGNKSETAQSHVIRTA